MFRIQQILSRHPCFGYFMAIHHLHKDPLRHMTATQRFVCPFFPNWQLSNVIPVRFSGHNMLFIKCFLKVVIYYQSEIFLILRSSYDIFINTCLHLNSCYFIRKIIKWFLCGLFHSSIQWYKQEMSAVSF